MSAAMPPSADIRRVGAHGDGPVVVAPGGHTSGVSWGAIFAGAAAAAALSLILLVLGTGLGLASVSPWANRGASAMTLGVSTIAWLMFTQVAASGMGGYLAGRLRTKWVSVHTDEVYFRDTAHGFLAWAVATLLAASVLTSVIGSIASGSAQVGVSVAGAAAAGSVVGRSESSSVNDAMGMGYFVDTLFRKDLAAVAPTPAPAADASSLPTNAEVARIFVNDLRSGAMPAEDARYVGQLVALRTGLPSAESEKRVTEVFTKVQATLKEAETNARDAAEKARKASAYAALWLFVSLLVGAFIASLCATFGGRRRDL